MKYKQPHKYNANYAVGKISSDHMCAYLNYEVKLKSLHKWNIALNDSVQNNDCVNKGLN